MAPPADAPALPETAHVLLVEDDDGMRVLVTRLLRESGYRVTGCRSGAEMWSLLPETPVDLVLLDVMLPGASGFDLLRALRAKGTVPVIMLSAHTGRGEDMRAQALIDGASGCFNKANAMREKDRLIQLVKDAAHREARLDREDIEAVAAMRAAE